MCDFPNAAPEFQDARQGDASQAPVENKSLKFIHSVVRSKCLPAVGSWGHQICLQRRSSKKAVGEEVST